MKGQSDHPRKLQRSTARIILGAGLAAAIVVLSPHAHAENLNKKWGPSWDCSYISLGAPGSKLDRLYKSCKRCEDADMDFYRTSDSSGRCVARERASRSPAPQASLPGGQANDPVNALLGLFGDMSRAYGAQGQRDETPRHSGPVEEADDFSELVDEPEPTPAAAPPPPNPFAGSGAPGSVATGNPFEKRASAPTGNPFAVAAAGGQRQTANRDADRRPETGNGACLSMRESGGSAFTLTNICNYKIYGAVCYSLDKDYVRCDQPLILYEGEHNEIHGAAAGTVRWMVCDPGRSPRNVTPPLHEECLERTLAYYRANEKLPGPQPRPAPQNFNGVIAPK